MLRFEDVTHLTFSWNGVVFAVLAGGLAMAWGRLEQQDSLHNSHRSASRSSANSACNDQQFVGRGKKSTPRPLAKDDESVIDAMYGAAHTQRKTGKMYMSGMEDTGTDQGELRINQGERGAGIYGSAAGQVRFTNSIH